MHVKSLNTGNESPEWFDRCRY